MLLLLLLELLLLLLMLLLVGIVLQARMRHYEWMSTSAGCDVLCVLLHVAAATGQGAGTAANTNGGRATAAAKAGRGVLPHVDAALRTASQFAYVVHSVVAARIRQLIAAGALTHQLPLGEEAPLRTAAVGNLCERLLLLLLRLLLLQGCKRKRQTC